MLFKRPPEQEAAAHAATAADIKIFPLAEKPEFFERIVDWNVGEWGKLLGSKAESIVRSQYYDRLNTDKLPIAYVATLKVGDAEILMGTFSLVGDIYDLHPNKEAVFLSRFYVPAEYRGQGIARAMMSAVYDKVAALKLGQLLMVTVEDNIKNICLAHDWTVIETLNETKGVDIYGNDYDFGKSVILQAPGHKLELKLGDQVNNNR